MKKTLLLLSVFISIGLSGLTTTSCSDDDDDDNDTVVVPHATTDSTTTDSTITDSTKTDSTTKDSTTTPTTPDSTSSTTDSLTQAAIANGTAIANLYNDIKSNGILASMDRLTELETLFAEYESGSAEYQALVASTVKEQTGLTDSQVTTLLGLQGVTDTATILSTLTQLGLSL